MNSGELTAILKAHLLLTHNKKGGARADLSEQDVSGNDFSGLKLTSLRAPSANFSRCTLVQTDFELSDFFDASFAYADCRGTNFRNADLRGTSFHGAKLAGAIFDGADLRSGRIIREGKTTNQADLSAADMPDTD